MEGPVPSFFLLPASLPLTVLHKGGSVQASASPGCSFKTEHPPAEQPGAPAAHGQAVSQSAYQCDTCSLVSCGYAHCSPSISDAELHCCLT